MVRDWFIYGEQRHFCRQHARILTFVFDITRSSRGYLGVVMWRMTYIPAPPRVFFSAALLFCIRWRWASMELVVPMTPLVPNGWMDGNHNKTLHTPGEVTLNQLFSFPDPGTNRHFLMNRQKI